jgi:tRNA-modifying protein YgfZ
MSAVTVFERFDCGVVAVEGPDALSYLQSLVSQDLDALADGATTRSLLLQPQGKLTATFGLQRISPEAVLLYTDEGCGAVLADGLRRFKIRVKAEIDDRSDTWGVLTVHGASDAPPGVVFATALGFDVVGPLDELRATRDALVASGAHAGADDAYERLRIEHGVPRQGVDIDDRTIPQEAFLERDAVSFTKGCFLGQELVCRIDTRGHVNRFLRRVAVEGAVPPVGAEVVVDADRAVGALTSVAAVPEGAVALAMVRREVEPPAAVTVRWNGTTAKATVTNA